MRNNQNGFGLVWIALLLLILSILGVYFYRMAATKVPVATKEEIENFISQVATIKPDTAIATSDDIQKYCTITYPKFSNKGITHCFVTDEKSFQITELRKNYESATSTTNELLTKLDTILLQQGYQQDPARRVTLTAAYDDFNDRMYITPATYIYRSSMCNMVVDTPIRSGRETTTSPHSTITTTLTCTVPTKEAIYPVRSQAQD